MQAIVLAGGAGTRLRPLVSSVPKPMATIAGRPFLEILLTRLSSLGFESVVLSLGYLADSIVTYFGDRFRDMELSYEIEKVPLGTGGAMRAALQRCSADYVYVFNGDTFMEIDPCKVDSAMSRRPDLLIVTREVSETGRYGRVQHKHGIVTGFTEKGVTGPGLINAGCYVVRHNLLQGTSPHSKFSFEEDFLPQAIINLSIACVIADGLFIDIGTPADYLKAEKLLSEGGVLDL